MRQWTTNPRLLITASVLASACSERLAVEEQCEPRRVEGEGPAPVLLGNQMVDRSTIRLTFTEPIAPVDCVDPEKFRISAAFGYIADIEASYYVDPAGWDSACPATPTAEACCYYVCMGADCLEECIEGPVSTRVMEITNDPNDDRSLLLELNQPINDYTCMFADVLIDYQDFEGGLFVHYSPGEIPRVQSESGGDLAAIAEHWVLSGAPYTLIYEIYLPNLDPPLPFACP